MKLKPFAFQQYYGFNKTMVSYRNHMSKNKSFNTIKNCKKVEVVYVANTISHFLKKTFTNTTTVPHI